MDETFKEIKNIFESTFNCKVETCTMIHYEAICIHFKNPREGQWFEENLINSHDSPITNGMIIIESPAETESYKYSFTVKDQEKLIQQILKYNN